ncbi:hypothetical protein TL16_g00539 [Triparma laevis f. inornata]|uniref:TLC domain-containing protein n=1 Tax=Triparma laevis f. inornata TaxID=1714386 RepID=A0A9W6ZC67_9STRA|nr:hypothetical protein TL16_g00539 [Triparma laevis f. inornata]
MAQHQKKPSSPTERIYGCRPSERLLLDITQAFQFWDLLMSILIPHHRTPIMLVHHALAFLVSYYASRYTTMLHYGVFFCAISELSSVPLCFMDLNNILGGYWKGWWVEAIKMSFVLFFFVFRVVLWMGKFTPRLFSDSIYCLELDTAVCRPGLAWHIKFFCAVCAVLGALQLYWMGLIINLALQEL